MAKWGGRKATQSGRSCKQLLTKPSTHHTEVFCTQLSKTYHGTVSHLQTSGLKTDTHIIPHLNREWCEGMVSIPTCQYTHVDTEMCSSPMAVTKYSPLTQDSQSCGLAFESGYVDFATFFNCSCMRGHRRLIRSRATYGMYTAINVHPFTACVTVLCVCQALHSNALYFALVMEWKMAL